MLQKWMNQKCIFLYGGLIIIFYHTIFCSAQSKKALGRKTEINDISVRGKRESYPRRRHSALTKLPNWNLYRLSDVIFKKSELSYNCSHFLQTFFQFLYLIFCFYTKDVITKVGLPLKILRHDSWKLVAGKRIILEHIAAHVWGDCSTLFLLRSNIIMLC